MNRAHNRFPFPGQPCCFAGPRLWTYASISPSPHRYDNGAIARGSAQPIERHRIIGAMKGKLILSYVPVERAIKYTLPMNWVGAT